MSAPVTSGAKGFQDSPSSLSDAEKKCVIARAAFCTWICIWRVRHERENARSGENPAVQVLVAEAWCPVSGQARVQAALRDVAQATSATVRPAGSAGAAACKGFGLMDLMPVCSSACVCRCLCS